LCVCFLSLVLVCDMWFLVIPVIIFIALTLVFPIYMLISTMFVKKSLLHTQPTIEATAKICFVREQMMLATIFDSFCINNFTTICGKPFVTGKIMAIHNFLLQDLPQTLIHLLFLFLVTHEEGGEYGQEGSSHEGSYHEDD
jgi:ABC-type sugar transport system permease subunit